MQNCIINWHFLIINNGRPHPIYLANVSKYFTKDEIKKIALNGDVLGFSIYCDLIDLKNIINMEEYVIKTHNIK